MNTKFIVAILMVPCAIYGVGSEDINEMGELLEKRSVNHNQSADDMLKNVEQKEVDCLKFMTQNPEGGKEEVGAFYNAVVAYKESVIKMRNAPIEVPMSPLIISGLVGAFVARMYYWSMNCQ